MQKLLSTRTRPSDKYQVIYKTYYSERYDDRYAQLRETFDRLVYPTLVIKKNSGWGKVKSLFSKDISDLFSENDEVFAEINPLLAEQVVKAYLIDLIRYKEYHYNPRDANLKFDDYAKAIHQDSEEARRLDRDKATAFLVKWILKIKPIQITLGKDFDFKNDTLVNKVNYINTDFALMIAANMLRIDFSQVPSKQRIMLRHQFQYRPFDENIFSMLFSVYVRHHRV